MGTADFASYLGFTPTPKSHSGVDSSAYTFEGWYKEDGTKFTASTVVISDITIYPSWDTSLYTYSKSSGQYSMTKKTGVVFAVDEDLYIPGWRYKGLTISSIGQNAFANIEVDNLYIGDGIDKILFQSFANVKANSLYLGEGLTLIKQEAFKGSKIFGSLKIPSTLVII